MISFIFTMSSKRTSEKSSHKANLRFRKKVHKYIHTHTALTVICVLSVIDSAFVVGELMLDVFIFKEREQTMTLRANVISKFLTDLMPEVFHGISGLADLTDIIEHLPSNLSCGYIGSHNSSHVGSEESNAETPPAHKLSLNATSSFQSSSQLANGKEMTDEGKHVHSRFIKKSTSAHGEVTYWEYIEYQISHALHYGSISILSIMVLVVIVRVYALQSHFFKRKLEVWDAIVVIIAFSLDLFLLDSIQMHLQVDAAYLLIIVLPWRVIRVINSFVMTVKEKDKIRLKYLLTSRKKALRRLSVILKKLEKQKREMKAIRSLCKRHGIKDKKIDECISGVEMRRRSFPLAMLTSFASMTMIGTLGTKDSTFNEASDDDFSDTDIEDVVDHEQSQARHRNSHKTDENTHNPTTSDSGCSVVMDEVNDSPNFSSNLCRRRSVSLESLESGLAFDNPLDPSTGSLSSATQLSLQMDESSSDVFYPDDTGLDNCSTQM